MFCVVKIPINLSKNWLKTNKVAQWAIKDDKVYNLLILQILESKIQSKYINNSRRNNYQHN